MFPYGYVFSLLNEKSTNQSLILLDCNVNEDPFFSSCLFTFGFYYILPLTIIGISYSRVFLFIRQEEKKIAKQVNEISLRFFFY